MTDVETRTEAGGGRGAPAWRARLNRLEHMTLKVRDVILRTDQGLRFQQRNLIRFPNP